MPNGTYGGVRGRKTKVGRKLLRFPPTRFPKEQRTRLSYLNKIRLENNTIREMIKNVVK